MRRVITVPVGRTVADRPKDRKGLNEPIITSSLPPVTNWGAKTPIVEMQRPMKAREWRKRKGELRAASKATIDRFNPVIRLDNFAFYDTFRINLQHLDITEPLHIVYGDKHIITSVKELVGTEGLGKNSELYVVFNSIYSREFKYHVHAFDQKRRIGMVRKSILRGEYSAEQRNEGPASLRGPDLAFGPAQCGDIGGPAIQPIRHRSRAQEELLRRAGVYKKW